MDARCAAPADVTRAHAFWCWRLRLPLVVMERKSPRSRFGRVTLDLFPTAHALTRRGQAEMERLGAVRVSPHDAVWEDVPAARIEEVARTVLRAATRPGNYEVRKPAAPKEILRMFEVIEERMAEKKKSA